MLKTLVAGLALASSWTWIIGMYLPRIMMERHGWAGFLAFAVPNVIGCTAFGFVLRKPARPPPYALKLRAKPNGSLPRPSRSTCCSRCSW